MKLFTPIYHILIVLVLGAIFLAGCGDDDIHYRRHRGYRPPPPRRGYPAPRYNRRPRHMDNDDWEDYLEEREERREEWEDHREDIRDYRRDRWEDRRDYERDRWEDRRERREEWREERQERWEDRYDD